MSGKKNKKPYIISHHLNYVSEGHGAGHGHAEGHARPVYVKYSMSEPHDCINTTKPKK